ncbi:MAG: ABC transporter ATP-binding protein [Promethearchaeota archaeon]|nr:MAG: ABC transporter ATP-binding protein [Candidatus Lokiarchaeota archaeon]
MESAIKLENISKMFLNKKQKNESQNREVWALGGISLEVKKGEIFGLLGPNGAGKTTAIRCIAGILKPNSGKIFIKDQEMNRLVAHQMRKDLGFLTENHGNYENLTLYENLEFYGSFFNIINLDSKIDSVLEEMGLIERKNMKAGKLSKGQKQRLAIARTILHDPEILFFDEPTAGLDPSASVHVRNLIQSLKRSDRTIFINSHNLEEVQKVCDRVAILDLGKIKRIGKPSDLGKELWETQEMICILEEPIPTNLDPIFSKLDYLKRYHIEGNKIYFYSDDINKATPKIVRELVNANANILEIKRTVHSLEDIYLKLMNENGA